MEKVSGALRRCSALQVLGDERCYRERVFNIADAPRDDYYSRVVAGIDTGFPLSQACVPTAPFFDWHQYNPFARYGHSLTRIPPLCQSLTSRVHTLHLDRASVWLLATVAVCWKIVTVILPCKSKLAPRPCIYTNETNLLLLILYELLPLGERIVVAVWTQKIRMPLPAIQACAKAGEMGNRNLCYWYGVMYQDNPPVGIPIPPRGLPSAPFVKNTCYPYSSPAEVNSRT